MYWCPSAVLNKGSDTCCDARTSCKYDSDCCKYLKIDDQFTRPEESVLLGLRL